MELAWDAWQATERQWIMGSGGPPLPYQPTTALWFFYFVFLARRSFESCTPEGSCSFASTRLISFSCLKLFRMYAFSIPKFHRQAVPLSRPPVPLTRAGNSPSIATPHVAGSHQERNISMHTKPSALPQFPSQSTGGEYQRMALHSCFVPARAVFQRNPDVG